MEQVKITSETFLRDLNNSMDALEDYIVRWENDLLDSQVGDEEWTKLDEYKSTLENLKLVVSIYG